MWDILAGVAGSALGGLFGSQPQQQTTTTEPWKKQQPYLKDVFRQGQSIYRNRIGPYDGGFYAGMDPMTAQGIAGVGGFSPYGQQISYGAMDAGAGLFGAGNAAMSGAAGLMGLGDPTQANIAAATQYANNPATQGMIDAANRDTARNLYENEIPGANRMNSMTGNQNSSRAGMREAMLTRAADDRMADTSAAIRGEQFNRGLTLAENARGTNLGFQATGAGQMAGLFGQGINAAASGQQQMYNNLDALVASGKMSQADAQGYIDEAFKQWSMKDNYDAEKLAQYQSAVSGNYGGTTTASSGGGMQGMAQGILGGAATGLGLYSKYNQVQNPTQYAQGSWNYQGQPNFNGLY